ncbi:MAG: hypothetical protein Q8K02_17410, partial [Flavobacterium sp.]|nr:hypothetical protein [Flavobacterium sp.]
MKKTLLFLLYVFSVPAFSQMSRVQVMVKPGFILYTNSNYDGNYSNDTGLNQIISTYTANSESTVVFVDNQALYSPSLGILTTDPVSAIALVNDLNNYDSVVYNAS